MTSLDQTLPASEDVELTFHSSPTCPPEGRTSPPEATRPIRRAIIRACSALAEARIEEAARATLQVNRLVESQLHRIPSGYVTALRMLQASLLAAEDRFPEARAILLSAPAKTPENQISATIFKYIEWKSQRLEYRAADAFDHLDPVIGGKTIHRIFGLCVSSAVEFDCLRPTVAANLASEALDLARECYGNSASVTALPATLMAQVAYEQGRFEEAETLLQQRLAAIRACGFVECVARAFVLLARLAVRRGESRSALSILRDAERIGRARRWPKLLSVVASEQARTLMTARGSAAGRAASSLSRPEEAAGTGIDRRQRPRSQSPRPPEPGQPSDSAASLDSGMSLRYSQLEVALNRASMAVSEGCIEDGYQILIPWLRVGAARGLCTVFSDAGPAVMGLLRNIYRGSDPITAPLAGLRPYLATLLKASAPKSPRQKMASSYRPLSRRETGVLELITHGMSNKRIAQSLGIAPETVKTHAKSIFAKLESRTRAQAVARAEAIGLL